MSFLRCSWPEVPFICVSNISHSSATRFGFGQSCNELQSSGNLVTCEIRLLRILLIITFIRWSAFASPVIRQVTLTFGYFCHFRPHHSTCSSYQLGHPCLTAGRIGQVRLKCQNGVVLAQLVFWPWLHIHVFCPGGQTTAEEMPDLEIPMGFTASSLAIIFMSIWDFIKSYIVK